MDILSITPGGMEKITLSLCNQGGTDQFQLSVLESNNSGLIFYDLNPSITNIEQNSSVAIEIVISTTQDIPEGLVETITIIAQSVLNNQINNFIEIAVIITARPSPLPPPNSEFVSSNYHLYAQLFCIRKYVDASVLCVPNLL